MTRLADGGLSGLRPVVNDKLLVLEWLLICEFVTTGKMPLSSYMQEILESMACKLRYEMCVTAQE